jgi:hypothetical protein
VIIIIVTLLSSMFVTIFYHCTCPWFIFTALFYPSLVLIELLILLYYSILHSLSKISILFILKLFSGYPRVSIYIYTNQHCLQTTLYHLMCSTNIKNYIKSFGIVYYVTTAIHFISPCAIIPPYTSTIIVLTKLLSLRSTKNNENKRFYFLLFSLILSLT